MRLVAGRGTEKVVQGEDVVWMISCSGHQHHPLNVGIVFQIA